MDALKRTEEKEAGGGDRVHQGARARRAENPEERQGATTLDCAVDEIVHGITEAANILRTHGQRARKERHWLVASILDRSAEYFTAPVQSLEEWERYLENTCELVAWLPNDSQYEDKPHSELKIHLLHFILSLDIDPQSRRQLEEVTQRPGRPGDVRPKAAYAIELSEKGQGWPEIERSLLPHRSNYPTGEAIRREVQRLKTVLSRHSIPVKSS
jgi:hypothetical protein